MHPANEVVEVSVESLITGSTRWSPRLGTKFVLTVDGGLVGPEVVDQVGVHEVRCADEPLKALDQHPEVEVSASVERNLVEHLLDHSPLVLVHWNRLPRVPSSVAPFRRYGTPTPSTMRHTR